MLLLRMKCGLGNQMFQYAAARSQAERLGCALAYTDYAVKWTSHVRLWATCQRRLIMAPRFDIDRWFELGGESPWVNQLRLQQFRLRYGVRPGQYQEPTIKLPLNIRELTRFDVEFFQIRPGCEINGFFQSESYFADRREQVRSWFQAKPEFLSKARAAADQTGVSPDKRCCLHVRRGDYLQMRNGDANEGWALPRSYYQNALARVPTGMKFVIVSDDPDWAREEFRSLNPIVFCHKSLAVIDLLILSECRVNVIANSSFSWWGAYLNSQPGREVLYPCHFLGWAVETELPLGISVAGWTDIPVRQNT